MAALYAYVHELDFGVYTGSYVEAQNFVSDYGVKAAEVAAMKWLVTIQMLIRLYKDPSYDPGYEANKWYPSMSMLVAPDGSFDDFELALAGMAETSNLSAVYAT